MRADGTPAGELVFFLHDEVMVHCPEAAVADCIRAIEEAANAAKELLFGRIPVEFPGQRGRRGLLRQRQIVPGHPP